MNHEFSIICITETWASDENGIPLSNNSNFQLPNYKIIDIPWQVAKREGGICAFVHNSLLHKVRTKLNSSNEHNAWFTPVA